jgi:signal transduction histidine kinase/CheY-like chemotaxis protein
MYIIEDLNKSAFKMNFLSRIDKDITLLLDNLPVGIIRFNDKSRCIYVNKFVINLLGLLSLNDVSSIYLNAVHKDEQQCEIDTCRKFLSDLVECNTTIRIFNKQLSEYRWMINKRTVVKSDDDNVSFMYTLQDVNENKLLEIQLRNETARAEQAYNHKSIFLANMSHEIRTPLNGIIGMLTLLEDTKLTTDQQDYISMVKECSYNLMTIINDILDYSKLEVGKITLDMKSMSLRECVESTNDIVLSKVYERSLEYTYNIDTIIPEYIYGDQNRIKQVLLNLLSNSIKFTDRGGIIINVNTIDEQEFCLLKTAYVESSDDNVLECAMQSENVCSNKLYIRFDIKDTGCGIDARDKKKLFKSFSQVDNQITSKIYQGTGLGLAISKELVELMGGVIWLDSSETNGGSTFSFVLPTVECDQKQQNCETNDSVLQNANVLIVDDNLHNRISLTAMITKWGMKPYVFSNGEEALHFTRLTKFDIGLIDICMPKMDGHSFAAKLREQKEFNNKEFPLVALSSLGDKMISKSKDFKTHLIKPIKESKLKKICVDLLHKRTNCQQQIKSDKELGIVQKITLDNYIDQNNLTEIKSNVRILLAEDVYINQKVVISFLNKLGYDNVQVVDNGQQCLDIAVNNEFDVILLDIRMPVMNGEVVLQELDKYYSRYSKTRPHIVAVTAYCLREDRERYLSMGFDDYIPKPITMYELKRCLNSYIERLLAN